MPGSGPLDSNRAAVEYCSRCGTKVRVIAERDRLVFYVCNACGLRGAFSVPERPAR